MEEEWAMEDQEMENTDYFMAMIHRVDRKV
jgi:hypothetical protein